MKQSRGTSYLSAWRQTVSDCGSTPRDAVEHDDRAVQHAQGALHLGGEVHVAGGVDHVDLVVLPEAGGGGGSDGDAALLLLFHPVHGGRALMDLADLVGLPGVEQDPLGEGGLAGVDVGDDADVADPIQGILSGHSRYLPSDGLAGEVGKGAVGLGHAVDVHLLLDGIALPGAAAISSAARRTAIGLPFFFRVVSISQRKARAIRRSPRTGIGT